MNKFKIDTLSKWLIGVVVVLCFMLWYNMSKIDTRIGFYSKVTDEMTFMYGDPYTLGYTIPMQVAFIVNDTVYVVTKDTVKKK
jgi:uncharacterized membrane protein YhhN